MRTLSRTLLAAGILAGIMVLPLPADYLKNSDLKDDLSGWHGDGVRAFLNADGTEGSDGDVDVTPVIKLSLSHRESRTVYQEFETPDNPKSLHIKVAIFASSDYQRSKSTNDYTAEIIDYSPGSNFQWSLIAICNVDFWIRAGPDWHYKLAKTIAGQWVTVDYKFTNTLDSDERSVYFCVPPGEGTIYIKNPSVEPQG